MKKLLICLFLFITTTSVWSQNLYIVNFEKTTELQNVFKSKNVSVNYFNDNFCIATGNNNSYELLENNSWKKGFSYFLVWLPNVEKESYITEISIFSKILYKDSQKLIIKIKDNEIEKLNPKVHSGIVKIYSTKAVLPKNKYFENTKNITVNPIIADYVSQVSGSNVMSSIQTLEDYGTRKYNTSEAILAQNWIKTQFENLGLNVELTSAGTTGSQNVIAKQIGSVYPNEYIVVGGHYDSTSDNPTVAPGADDNASGTSSVLEIARILSQYDFGRTIIYCAFSAEEIGLYGSAAWVESAVTQNLNIVGYLNLDMIGYLKPGETARTFIIAPSSTQPLIDLYTETTQTYVTDFTITGTGSLSGGDSDHTSFNNNGYMGIFPFEDQTEYSPYIHSVNDLIGQSVNSQTQVEKFTQAGVALVAHMSEPFNGLFPPINLQLIQNTDNLSLTWQQPSTKNFIKYNIYRNGALYYSSANFAETTFVDYSIANGNIYEYYITAVYDGSPAGESYPSNSVSATYGENQLYFWDFETGVQDWTILNSNIGWKWGLNVGITGNNTEYLGINSDAYGNGTHVFDYAISPVLNLTGYANPKLTFDYGYRNYSTDFFKLMYRLNSSSSWQLIEQLSASTSFTTKSINIPANLLVDGTQIAFYYDDNNTWAWYAGLDNIKITATEAINNLAFPTNLNYSLDNLNVILTWNAPTTKNLTGYAVYRSGVLIETINDSGIFTYTDSEISLNQEYTYYIKAIYSEGESAPSNQVIVQTGTSTIKRIENNINFKLFPNPAQNSVRIQFDSNKITNYVIEIVSLTGNVVKSISGNSNYNGINFHEINLNDVQQGIYLCKIKTDSFTKTVRFAIVK